VQQASIAKQRRLLKEVMADTTRIQQALPSGAHAIPGMEFDPQQWKNVPVAVRQLVKQLERHDEEPIRYAQTAEGQELMVRLLAKGKKFDPGRYAQAKVKTKQDLEEEQLRGKQRQRQEQQMRMLQRTQQQALIDKMDPANIERELISGVKHKLDLNLTSEVTTIVAIDREESHQRQAHVLDRSPPQRQRGLGNHGQHSSADDRGDGIEGDGMTAILSVRSEANGGARQRRKNRLDGYKPSRSCIIQKDPAAALLEQITHTCIIQTDEVGNDPKSTKRNNRPANTFRLRNQAGLKLLVGRAALQDTRSNGYEVLMDGAVERPRLEPPALILTTGPAFLPTPLPPPAGLGIAEMLLALGTA
jgi:hypothetical protein